MIIFRCVHNTGIVQLCARQSDLSSGTGSYPTLDLFLTASHHPSTVSLPHASSTNNPRPTSIDANLCPLLYRLPGRPRRLFCIRYNRHNAHCAPDNSTCVFPIALAHRGRPARVSSTPRRYDQIKPCKAKIRPWPLISLINLLSHCVRFFCPPCHRPHGPLGAQNLSALSARFSSSAIGASKQAPQAP